jgi:hypothetical protein
MAGYTKNPTENAYPGSTKNRGGDWDSGRRQGGDPFSYLKVEPEHAYLEHFRARKVLEEGHNTRRVRRIAASGQAVDPSVNPVLAAKVERRRAQVAAASGGPVAPTVAEGRASVRAAKVERRAMDRTGAERRAAHQSIRRLARAARRGVKVVSPGGY